MKQIFIIISIFLTIHVCTANNYSKTLSDISLLEKQGKYSEIDSLYAKLDSSGNISSHNLMKWAEVKFIIGDEITAGKIYCRAEEGRLLFLVRNSFLSNLRNVSESVQGQKSLKAYFDCKQNKSDTIPFIDWALRASSNLNYHSLELYFIDSFYKGKTEYTDELLSSSFKRISNGFSEEALKSSLKAWESTENSSKKRMAASLIFKSYLILGNNDSAFIWMKNSELNRKNEITEAIILCQKTANTSIADSLIKLLPAGINKDTLTLRNFIFKNDINQALTLCNRLSQKYNNNYSDVLLFWESRLLLFAGESEKLISILNSDKVKRIPFNNQYKTDFLKWKTALTQLQNDNENIAVLGTISKFNYTNNYLPYNPFIQYKHWSKELKTFILNEYLRGIIENKNYQMAIPLLNEISEDCLNEELLYYSGIIKINTNSIDTGKKVLEDLILNGKGSLFSQKARIYLLKKFSEN